MAGFQDTRYEHYLASAVALAWPFERAARRGELVSQCAIQVRNVEVGTIIKDCVAEVDAWQRGGNTLLGTSILLVPVAVAAGMASFKGGVFDILAVRSNIKQVVEATTAEDAVSVYEAIRLANPGGLGKSAELDVNDPCSIERIRREQISLLRVFKISSSYDLISSELVNGYPITFDLAYPFLTEETRKGKDLNQAIVHTFLKVLAACPDTFIARKTNLEMAKKISAEAREILSLGGLETLEGRRGLTAFDARLRRSSNLLNPGATADIVATALAICTLGGYRP